MNSVRNVDGSEMALMNFRLCPDFHRAFKIEAAIQDKTMSVFLSDLTNDFLESGATVSDDNPIKITGVGKESKICQFRIPSSTRDSIQFISNRDGVSMVKTFEAIWNSYKAD